MSRSPWIKIEALRKLKILKSKGERRGEGQETKRICKPGASGKEIKLERDLRQREGSFRSTGRVENTFIPFSAELEPRTKRKGQSPYLTTSGEENLGAFAKKERIWTGRTLRISSSCVYG